MKKLPMIFGIILLVSYFLPWVSTPANDYIPSVNLSGSQITSLGALVSAKAYFLYLVPILGIAVAVLGFMQHSASRIVTLVAGAFILLMGIWGMAEAGFGETMKVLGFGAWLTLLACIGCIVSFFIAFKD